MPGKPSMDGVEERQNQTLKDIMRKSLWGEALKTVVYILNRVLTKAVNKIPYQLWTGKKSFFETGNARILEEVEFGKEENIRNVLFEEESVNDIGQVLVPITIQETTLIIGDNVQIIVHTIIPDIVPEQDYGEVLPQTSIEQPQQPQEVSLRRYIRERRHAIPNDYIIFLQEHEDDIGLTKDDPINFGQAMQSSNYQKWIDAMKD
ncbi:hypothetical protein CR513_43327, partial [Mucuna pruriens]